MAPTTIDLEAIKEVTWSITTTYTVSQMISYNLALGASGTALDLVYEGHPNFHALPTYGAVHGIAIMGLIHRAMFDFLPNFKGHNHVHGEHYLEAKRLFRIPQGADEVKLKTTAKVVDIVDRKTAVLVHVDIETMEEQSGEVVCLNEWVGFVLRTPPEGSNKKQLQRGARTTLYPTPNRAPDKTTSHRTSPEQAALYRAASGDLNPLHIDPETAKAAGFPAPILTGTCTLGIGVRHVVDAFADGDAKIFKSVKCRLSQPLHASLSEEVRTEMWKEGSRVLFRMVVDGDSGVWKVVISQGCVELKVDDGARL
ncbi:HotDog domain-containing protein [Lophiotrema nucula]|uniref:HotDog domain-containing protein n=1 Tax=Lophiotrema nucula TaxID=690887 RepID=A0A6A5YKN9_9PLEO|nr:HotDog domain-containing protein [Lophiotrema nucula]